VTAWTILQWPFVLFLVSTAIGIVYYFAPDAEQDWVWLTPGSILATLLWLTASLGSKWYIAYMGSYTETYGVVGGVMILMLWFYLSGVALLLGAELNAEIEHASPYGKAPGEKAPGQKRKIGPAAMRAWLESQHGQKHGEQTVTPVPAPAPEQRVARSPLALPAPSPSGASYWMLGAGIVAAQIWMAIKALKNSRILV
jgi:membrane protein